MAHLLHRLGAAALLPRRQGDKLLAPLIGLQEALKLREQYYAIGQPWPYENIVPGKAPAPPGCDTYEARRRAQAEKKAARVKAVTDAMASMNKLISEYKSVRRIDWGEVSEVDKLLMTPRQIKDKYVKKRLAKQG